MWCKWRGALTEDQKERWADITINGFDITKFYGAIVQRLGQMLVKH